MNFKRIKTTAAAGILAASMILPNMTAFAALNDDGGVDTAQIKKTVQADANVSGIPTADKDVTFLVHQVGNASGNTAPSSVSDSYVTIDVSTAAGESTDFAQAILADVSGLTTGEYTFEVTETLQASGSDFGWTSVNTEGKTYYLRVVVKSDGTKLYFITASNTAGATKIETADFINVYNKKSIDEGGNANTLTVTKTIDDDDAAYINNSETYPITITFNVPDEQTAVNKGTSYVVTSPANAEWSYADGVVTISANIARNESIVVSNIAVGATYSVSEDTSSLDSTFQGVDYTVEEGSTQLQNKGTACSSMTFKNASQTVDVHNDFQNITITGVVTDVAPYVTLVVVAVAAIAAYVIMKRRIAR